MSVFIFVPMPTRSEELMARVPMPKKKTENHPEVLVTDDHGNIEHVHTDLPEAEYSRETRGEAALNAALERGRQIDAAAMEMVAPLLTNLRSRISSFASRALGMLKSTIGFGGEVSDAASNTVGATAELARDLPGGAGKMAKFAYEDAIKPIGEAVRDIVNPAEIDTEKLSTLDTRILALTQAIDATRNTETRMALDVERQKLEGERQAVLNPPQSKRKGAKLLKGAGGAVLSAGVAVAGGAAMGAAAGYNATERGVVAARDYVVGKLDARRQEQEARKLEQEEARIARAELFLMDAAETTGTAAPTLSREALLAMGKGLEESFTRKLSNGAKQIGKALLFVDDVRDITGNLQTGASEFNAFLQSPADQAWLMNELRRFNVEAGAAIEDAFKIAARKTVIEPTKRAGRVVGKAAVATAKGTLTVGAGLAVAGAEALADTKTARATREAILTTWEKHKPAVQHGLTRTVEEMNLFADYSLDVPEALRREANAVAETMNHEAQKAVGFIERMQKNIQSALRIAQRKWNELKREILDETAVAEHPDIVASIDEALDAIDDLEELSDIAVMPQRTEDVPTPRNVKPVIRQTRGSKTHNA